MEMIWSFSPSIFRFMNCTDEKASPEPLREAFSLVFFRFTKEKEQRVSGLKMPVKTRQMLPPN